MDSQVPWDRFSTHEALQIDRRLLNPQGSSCSKSVKVGGTQQSRESRVFERRYRVGKRCASANDDHDKDAAVLAVCWWSLLPRDSEGP